MSDYLEENVKGIEEIWKLVKLTLEKSQISQKENADKSRKEHNFKIFDLVFVKIDHYEVENAHKFRPKWSGPWRDRKSVV